MFQHRPHFKTKKISSIYPSLFQTQHSNLHTKFAIIGGGTAGMNVTAQLLSSNTATPSDITVFEPSKTHYYQPGFTLVSGGVLGDSDAKVRQKLGGLIQKPMHRMFNSNINFVSDSISEYDPDNNRLYTSSCNAYSYDILVICSGIQLRYDLVEGLQQALDDPESCVGSMYNLQYALKINKIRSQFEGGKVIATQPPMPFKCGGAPQKWVYLTEYNFRRMGIKHNIESFKFYTHLNAMFGVKKYDRELRKLVQQKNITPVFQTELIKVESDKKLAWFRNNATNEIFSDSYDLMNVCPIQRPNIVTATAAFSDDNGYVDVNKYTLQSTKYENIFGAGDCTNCPNPKTAASIFAQTPTIVNNIKNVLNKESVIPSFDGYASCPILVGDMKVLLAEFVYDGVPNETFNFVGIDQAKPRRAFYYLKRYLFPWSYWNMAPRGSWYGTTAIFKPRLKAIQGADIGVSQLRKLKAN